MKNLYGGLMNSIENRANLILDYCNVPCRRNNLANYTDVDLVTSSGKKIDVQYSTNFALYGDIRIDFISSYFNQYVGHSSDLYPNGFEELFKITVKKPGKFFVNNYLDYIIVLLYNNNVPPNLRQDYTVVASKETIINCLNSINIFKKVKFNIKDNLPDTHGSAFVPVSLDLVLKSGGVLLTRSVMNENPNFLLEYMNR